VCMTHFDLDSPRGKRNAAVGGCVFCGCMLIGLVATINYAVDESRPVSASVAGLIASLVASFVISMVAAGLFNVGEELFVTARDFVTWITENWKGIGVTVILLSIAGGVLHAMSLGY